MSSKLAFYAAFAALANLTSAHMKIKTPTPYNEASLTTSPVSIANYPCQVSNGVYTVSAQNPMPVNAPQTLSFDGSAVHGGGSCQISLTSDKSPSASSQFKVIHSIIGGCPSNATDGNLGGGQGSNNYTFSIPNDVPNGDYALAWTWFNKIGNREMYMNCAPVIVSGSTGSTDSFNKLPDMFIANLNGGGVYTTPESGGNGGEYCVKFPDPGTSVEVDGPQASNFQPPCPPQTNGCTALPSGSSNNAASGASGAGAPAAGAAPSGLASSAGAQGPAATPAQGNAAPQGAASPAASPAAGDDMSGSSAGSAGTPGAAATPAAGAAGGAPGTCPTGSQQCQTPGAVVCIGTGQFGICDLNNCAVAQALASGTQCQNGVIARRDNVRYNSPLLRARHDHATAKHHV